MLLLRMCKSIYTILFAFCMNTKLNFYVSLNLFDCNCTLAFTNFYLLVVIFLFCNQRASLTFFSASSLMCYYFCHTNVCTLLMFLFNLLSLPLVCVHCIASVLLADFYRVFLCVCEWLVGQECFFFFYGSTDSMFV